MSDWDGNKTAVFVTNGDTSHSTRERETRDHYATDPRAVNKKIIFAYWIIYEYFYKRRKGIKPNNLRKQWRAAYKMLNKYPAWYYTAQAIHEKQKADK